MVGSLEGSVGRGRETVMMTGSARDCSSAAQTTVRPSQAGPGTRLMTVVRKYIITLLVGYKRAIEEVLKCLNVSERVLKCLKSVLMYNVA